MKYLKYFTWCKILIWMFLRPNYSCKKLNFITCQVQVCDGFSAILVSEIGFEETKSEMEAYFLFKHSCCCCCFVYNSVVNFLIFFDNIVDWCYTNAGNFRRNKNTVEMRNKSWKKKLFLSDRFIAFRILF